MGKVKPARRLAMMWLVTGRDAAGNILPQFPSFQPLADLQLHGKDRRLHPVRRQETFQNIPRVPK